MICGGLSKNQLFVQTHADVCSVPVLVPTEPESVLVGASMLGAAAAKIYPNLEVYYLINILEFSIKFMIPVHYQRNEQSC